MLKKVYVMKWRKNEFNYSQSFCTLSQMNFFVYYCFMVVDEEVGGKFVEAPLSSPASLFFGSAAPPPLLRPLFCLLSYFLFD